MRTCRGVPCEVTTGPEAASDAPPTTPCPENLICQVAEHCAPPSSQILSESQVVGTLH